MQNHTQEGEIHVKSPGMMLGYAGDPAETAAAETGDWFRTGDIGYCKDGKWYIIDRAKVRMRCSMCLALLICSTTGYDQSPCLASFPSRG